MGVVILRALLLNPLQSTFPISFKRAQKNRKQIVCVDKHVFISFPPWKSIEGSISMVGSVVVISQSNLMGDIVTSKFTPKADFFKKKKTIHDFQSPTITNLMSYLPHIWKQPLINLTHGQRSIRKWVLKSSNSVSTPGGCDVDGIRSTNNRLPPGLAGRFGCN